MKIIIVKNEEFTVDDEDYEYLSKFKWHLLRGYPARWSSMVNGKRHKIYMHREIMNEPDGFDVDHKDGNIHNLTRDNLRVASRSGNRRNSKKGTNTKNIYKGVTENHGSYQVAIVIDGKNTYIGKFSNAEAGANCYNYYAQKYYGEFARLNDVQHMEDWGSYKKHVDLVLPIW